MHLQDVTCVEAKGCSAWGTRRRGWAKGTGEHSEGAVAVSATQPPRPQASPLGKLRVTITILIHVISSLLVCLLKKGLICWSSCHRIWGFWT